MGRRGRAFRNGLMNAINIYVFLFFFFVFFWQQVKRLNKTTRAVQNAKCHTTQKVMRHSERVHALEIPPTEREREGELLLHQYCAIFIHYMFMLIGISMRILQGIVLAKTRWKRNHNQKYCQLSKLVSLLSI